MKLQKLDHENIVIKQDVRKSNDVLVEISKGILKLTFHFLFKFTLPVKKNPEFSFLIITFYCFIIVSYSI